MEMEKKKCYRFKTFDSKGKEVELNVANILYDITEDEAQLIRLGMLMGLLSKYKDPKVTYEIATDEDELPRLDEILEEDW